MGFCVNKLTGGGAKGGGCVIAPGLGGVIGIEKAEGVGWENTSGAKEVTRSTMLTGDCPRVVVSAILGVTLSWQICGFTCGKEPLTPVNTLCDFGGAMQELSKGLPVNCGLLRDCGSGVTAPCLTRAACGDRPRAGEGGWTLVGTGSASCQLCSAKSVTASLWDVMVPVDASCQLEGMAL
jgi:hypothetical protein